MSFVNLADRPVE